VIRRRKRKRVIRLLTACETRLPPLLCDRGERKTKKRERERERERAKRRVVARLKRECTHIRFQYTFRKRWQLRHPQKRFYEGPGCMVQQQPAT
jgi:hypothetical protein